MKCARSFSMCTSPRSFYMLDIFGSKHMHNTKLKLSISRYECLFVLRKRAHEHIYGQRNSWAKTEIKQKKMKRIVKRSEYAESDSVDMERKRPFIWFDIFFILFFYFSVDVTDVCVVLYFLAPWKNPIKIGRTCRGKSQTNVWKWWSERL